MQGLLLILLKSLKRLILLNNDKCKAVSFCFEAALFLISDFIRFSLISILYKPLRTINSDPLWGRLYLCIVPEQRQEARVLNATNPLLSTSN